MAAGWKKRIQTRTVRSADGRDQVVTREAADDILMTVRAFYLDLAQWALDEPARWGPRAVLCPIRSSDIQHKKQKARTKARMDQRTRERLPVLPALAAAVDHARTDAADRLEAARAAGPGELFTAGGQALRRARTARPSRRVWAEDPGTGRRRDLTREEDNAFWAWAAIEVLRHTRVRIEELTELAAAGKAGELQLALARHAAASPDTLGFLYIDGHTRAYFGKRDLQKMHLARLKFPGPATEETRVTGSAGDPLLVVMAQPSSSLAAQIRDLLPALRDITGPGTRPVLCFDRGGWSPALFPGIADAGFDLLTYRKNDAGSDIPDLPEDAFTAASWPGDDGHPREYELADTTISLTISDGEHKGRVLQLRQVTRRKARRHPPGAHPAYPPRRRAARRRRDLPDDLMVAGGELLPLRPRPVRPRRPGHLRHHPRGPRPAGPEPGEENRRCRRQGRKENPHQRRDRAPRQARRPAQPRPGTATMITNQVLARLDAPVDGARRDLQAAQAAGADLRTALWRGRTVSNRPSPRRHNLNRKEA